MTPEELALFRRNFSQGADEPRAQADTVLPPPESQPAPTEDPAARLRELLPPEHRVMVDALNRHGSSPWGRKVLESIGANYKKQDEAEAAKALPNLLDRSEISESKLPEPIGLTVGEVGEFNPELAERWGLHEAAKAIREAGSFRTGAPNGFNASPFSAELGSQKAGNLKIQPLQRMNGEYDASAPGAQKRLTELYTMKLAKKSDSLDAGIMADIRRRANEMAQRDIARAVLTPERRGNMLAESRPDIAIQNIRTGSDLPWPTYLTGLPAATWAMRKGAELRGKKPEDTALPALIAPALAMTRPGSGTYDSVSGEPVSQGKTEGGFWWFLRLAPSTAVASWLLDPEATYELGGEKGWGGERHIKKITGGYELFSELPGIASKVDDALPGDHPIVSTIAAAAPLLMVTLFEPDIPSLATMGVGKIVKTGLGGLKSGRAVIKSALPVLEQWHAASASGVKAADIIRGARPGTVEDLLAKTSKAEAINTIVSEAGTEAALAKKINPESMGNVDALADTANVRAADSAQATSDAVKAEAKVDDDIVQDLIDSGTEYTKARKAWGVQSGDALRAAADARKAYHDAESAMLAVTAIRGPVSSGLAAGEKLMRLADGAQMEFVEYVVRASNTGVKNLIKAVDNSGVVHLVDPKLVARSAAGARPIDIVNDLAKLKKRREALLAAKYSAEQAGDATKVSDLAGQLERLRPAIIKNTEDAARMSAEVSYMAARDLMADAMGKLSRVMAAVPQLRGIDPKLVKQLKLAEEALKKAVSKEAIDQRQAAALARAEEAFRKALERQIVGAKAWLSAESLGKLDAATMGRGVVDDMFGQGGLEWPKYQAELIQRYGAEAVDQVMNSPLGRPFRSGANMAQSPGNFQAVRQLEEAIFNAAEGARMGKFAPASVALNTVRDFKSFRGFDKLTWNANMYRFLNMFRVGDWVGATAVGRAPKMVREVVRRSYERFAGNEHDMSEFVGRFGLDGIKQFLTTTTKLPGIYGNQDPFTHSNKALEMLRAASAAGDGGWHGNQVVDALANAGLASFRSSAGEPQSAVVIQLRKLVDDPDTTGDDLWNFVESQIANTYSAISGKSDSRDVILGFVGRALIQASNQYDTIFDLMRATGARISPDAAASLNWFKVQSAPLRSPVNADQAFGAAQQYGMPFLDKSQGAINSVKDLLFASSTTANELVKFADLRGYELFIPKALKEAMDAVPRNLVKEVREFKGDDNRLWKSLDRYARLWRTTLVYGAVLPRVSHFVNTFFQDWSAMGMILGPVQGTKIAFQNAGSYIPFVGAAMSKQLAKSPTPTALGAMFDSDIAKIMSGNPNIVHRTAEGPMTNDQFMRECLEDGARDSIGTRELQEMTKRVKGRSWLDAPRHVEATAKFMEAIQSRQRIMLLHRARTGALTGTPMQRGEAVQLMQKTLYEWKTGLPQWEYNTFSALTMYWTQQRLMMRQLGAIATEGLTDPAYLSKAMTGRTSLARMRQSGVVAESVWNSVNWQDPEENLDDEQQVKELLMSTAPWWRDNEWIFGNRGVTRERQKYYSEVQGRDVTVETLMLPALTTLDHLAKLNLVVQTMAASAAWIHASIGGDNTVVAAPIEEIWNKNVNAFADMMAPGASELVGKALHMGETQRRAEPLVSAAEMTLLNQMGFEDFVGLEPDAEGRFRVDPGAAGVAFMLVSRGIPYIRDSVRLYSDLVANPGYSESALTGITEALARYTGFLKAVGHDPITSHDYEARGAAADVDSLVKKAEKAVYPKPKF